MTPEKMSIDDLLTAQSRQSCIATVEPVSDEPEKVKITPWAKGAGCLCHLALKISKAAIESVTPTGDIHYCCGKTLRVVEIQFREDGAISLQDLFAQIMQTAQGGEPGGEPHHPFDWRGAVPGALPPQAAPFMPGFAPPSPPVGQEVEPFGMGGSRAEIPPGVMGMAPEMAAMTPAEPSLASLQCPTGTSPIYCGGIYQCMPSGSYCCAGQVVCRTDQSCQYCGGIYRCMPSDSYCCGGRVVCKTNQSCQSCGGIYQCMPSDSYCCGGRVVCKTDQSCQSCGGIYQCMPRGYYCCGGRVVCPIGYRCGLSNGVYRCLP